MGTSCFSICFEITYIKVGGLRNNLQRTLEGKILSGFCFGVSVQALKRNHVCMKVPRIVIACPNLCCWVK